MGTLRPPGSLAHRTPVRKHLAISAGDRGGSLMIFEIFDNLYCHMRQHKLFYARYMATSRVLDTQLHEMAWSIASRSRPGVSPAEPWDYDYEYPAKVEERRAGCLALLRVYTHMIKVLQRRIDLAVKEALSLDANYGDIATACGVSRQAARQRWLRHREQYEPPKVRLTGGPHDGEERERPRPGEEIIVTLWEAGPSRPSGYATYVPGSEDPSTYIFTGSQDYGWETADTQSQRPEKIRVYQLAKECSVESQVIMSKMRDMGEYVISASSIVEPTIAEKLRAHFRATA